jgi:hypothetical protein
MRVSKDDMASSTLKGYREIIDRVFRPGISQQPFEEILYSRLAEIVAASTQDSNKKTYNNITRALCARPLSLTTTIFPERAA